MIVSSELSFNIAIKLNSEETITWAPDLGHLKSIQMTTFLDQAPKFFFPNLRVDHHQLLCALVTLRPDASFEEMSAFMLAEKLHVSADTIFTAMMVIEKASGADAGAILSSSSSLISSRGVRPHLPSRKMQTMTGVLSALGYGCDKKDQRKDYVHADKSKFGTRGYKFTLQPTSFPSIATRLKLLGDIDEAFGLARRGTEELSLLFPQALGVSAGVLNCFFFSFPWIDCFSLFIYLFFIPILRC